MPFSSFAPERDVDEFFNLTGSAMNRTRPHSARARVPVQEMLGQINQGGLGVEIDLYTFEDPRNDNSKYVLTSPRSLEACSRLNVKPVEILYKPLIDFQEELVPRGIPLKTIYSIYEEHEKERLSKLDVCREEREKIVESSMGRADMTSPIIMTSARLAQEKLRNIANRGTTGAVTFEDFEDVGTPRRVEELEVKPSSLQRMRTAWATSIGHERVTAEEIDRRAQEIFERGRKSKVVSSAAKRPKRPRQKSVLIKAPPGGRKVLTKKQKTQVNKQGKKQQRQNASKEEENSVSLKDIETSTNGMAPNAPPSVSDVSASSSRASRWARETENARPVTDSTLRSKLRSARTPGTKVMPRRSASIHGRPDIKDLRRSDQRILELMMAKREGEKKQMKEKEVAHRQWEEQKNKDLATRLSLDVQRRRSISETRRKDGGSKHGSTQSLADNDLRPGRQDQDGRRSSEGTVKPCDKQWSEQSRRLLLEKERKIKEKRLQSMERKKSQEVRLQQQQKELDEFHAAVVQRQQSELKRAQSLKETKEQEIALQRKMRNYYSKKKQQERLNDIKKKEEAEKKNLRRSVEMKSHTISSKIQHQNDRREKELSRNRRDLQDKIETSRKNQKKLEEELAIWHRDLDGYRRRMGQKAEEQARLKIEEKRRRAIEDRIQKEKQQRENMKKLLEQEEEWKADVEATIAMKDARTRIIQMEKEEAIAELRSLAQASQRLRDELKSAYSTDQINQMAQKAEIEAKIGAGVHNATKNMSTLTLG